MIWTKQRSGLKLWVVMEKILQDNVKYNHSLTLDINVLCCGCNDNATKPFVKDFRKNAINMTAPIHILLVEDEDINNYIAARLIQKALPGAKVTACLNGRKAIELLTEIKDDSSKLPDIILLDISMPVMNGWQFLDEYNRRKIDPLGKSAIFILSSSVYSDDINRSRLYSQVKGFVCKPLNVEKIRELITREEAVLGP